MIYQYLLDQGFEKKNPKRTSPWLLSLLKNAIWNSKKGPPHKLPHLTIKAVIVLTNIWYSSIFYASVSAANTWWHPNHTSKEELVLVNLVRSFSRSQDLHWKRATCGGHLWGALVGGHPSKPQKKQFFHLTVVGKLSCFRELHFFPKQLKIQLLPKTQICIGNEIEYQHAHILCMVFCNLFSRNGLNLYCSNMFKPFPMDLHHLWGGPFAVKKMHFLVH